MLFPAVHQGEPAGFAQCQLRHDYVQGTRSSPVGYLEGIFVRENCRRQGYARELLASLPGLGRRSGLPGICQRLRTYQPGKLPLSPATGFGEAGRIICFVKELSPSPREKE